MAWKAGERGLAINEDPRGRLVVGTKAKVMRSLALASLLPADLGAATPFRMSSERSLLFCATHSRGIVQAEHLGVQLRSHSVLSVGDSE